ncbi:hypothetical protein WJX73_010515 [Symbiochloris irregularis]|uniref:Uncharacterized protein n=1 Tax=Symbiochloris irregularis TaxID=706552 RepID=A0AAW1NUT3_9CHLO
MIQLALLQAPRPQCQPTGQQAVASEVRSYLEQIALAKSVLPEAEILGVWEDTHDDHSGTSALNHQCTQMLACKGNAVSMYQLNLDASPPTLVLAFREAPAVSANVDGISWSSDDGFAAISFSVFDSQIPEAQEYTGYFGALWV